MAPLRILLSLVLLIGTAFSQAVPTWKTIGKEGDSLTLPKGSIIRYGNFISVYATDVGAFKTGEASPESWSPLVTLQVDTTFIADNTFFGGDPIYGVSKIVQLEQTSVLVPTKSLNINWTNPPDTCYTMSGSYIDASRKNQTYTATICLHPQVGN